MSNFVQFMHPGPEPKAVSNGYKPWNQVPNHQRSFIKSRGTALNSEGEALDADLVFWGEWEGPASATRLDGHEPGQPTQLFDPISENCPTGGQPQNTDPFVFGDEFLYCCCRQKPGNVLSRLEQGDVILFGSNLDNRFVLDTVFVVDRYKDYDPANWVASFGVDVPSECVPDEFVQATLKPLARYGSQNYRLYRGATFRKRVNNMFSYVPAKALLDSPCGFARPSLDLDFMARNVRSYRYCLANCNPEDCHRAWHEVREAVLEKGLLLGVQLASPATSTHV